jgi:hypothetical protein
MADAKCYVLEVGKHTPEETWARRGKPESAAHVRIDLSLDRALDLARQVIQHAMDRRQRGEEPVSFTLLGELTEEPEE